MHSPLNQEVVQSPLNPDLVQSPLNQEVRSPLNPELDHTMSSGVYNQYMPVHNTDQPYTMKVCF